MLNKFENEINNISIHNNYQGPSSLRPTTFEIVFHLDVPQDSAKQVLRRHNLTTTENWIAQHMFPFYIMRIVRVNLPKHKNLFETIHSVLEEENVYSAYPLYVRGGYALRHGPAPYEGNHPRKPNPYLHKMRNRLKQVYWTYRTASTEIAKNFIPENQTILDGDLIEIEILVEKVDSLQFLNFLNDNNIETTSSCENDSMTDLLKIDVLIKLPQLENLIDLDEIKEVRFPWKNTMHNSEDLIK